MKDARSLFASLRSAWRACACLLLMLCAAASLQAQAPPAATETAESPPEKAATTFGIRFGYGLEFPSENYYRGSEYLLFEAGHRFSYGAFVNSAADPTVQVGLYLGFDHTFFPKSLSYSQDCELDSFPTFWSVADTVPGRDFRLVSVTLEPYLLFPLRKLTVGLKVQPVLSYVFQTKVENYNHACNATLEQQWLDYEESELRSMSQFNLGLGFGIVKDVPLSEKVGVSLEPGFRMMLSPLFKSKSSESDGPSFSQYPWGFYLNLSLYK